jgi:hypothetical protein
LVLSRFPQALRGDLESVSEYSDKHRRNGVNSSVIRVKKIRERVEESWPDFEDGTAIAGALFAFGAIGCVIYILCTRRQDGSR